MKKIIVILSCGFILTAAVAAQAQSSRIYFAGYLGLSMPSNSAFSDSASATTGDIEYKNATSFGGAMGLRLYPSWRVEGEVSYRKNDIDRMDFAGGLGSFKAGGDIGSWLFMLNAYYDIDLEWDYLQPYLSAGVGMARHSAAVDDLSGLATDVEESSWNMAWQLGGGLKYRVNDALAFTGGYRYLGTSDPEFGDYETDYSGHEIRLGLEYDLPVSRGP